MNDRPKTRGDCIGGVRPCPWVACRHHLYLDVNPKTGTIRFNFPDVEPDDLNQTCALDVAENVAVGDLSSEIARADIGKVMNLSRERVRQIEESVLAKLRDHAQLAKEVA